MYRFAQKMAKSKGSKKEAKAPVMKKSLSIQTSEKLGAESDGQSTYSAIDDVIPAAPVTDAFTDDVTNKDKHVITNGNNDQASVLSSEFDDRKSERSDYFDRQPGAPGEWERSLVKSNDWDRKSRRSQGGGANTLKSNRVKRWRIVSSRHLERYSREFRIERLEDREMTKHGWMWMTDSMKKVSVLDDGFDICSVDVLCFALKISYDGFDDKG